MKCDIFSANKLSEALIICEECVVFHETIDIENFYSLRAFMTEGIYQDNYKSECLAIQC